MPSVTMSVPLNGGVCSAQLEEESGEVRWCNAMGKKRDFSRER